MCFSNLPIEFDEDGNPRLAQADDESEGGHEHGRDGPSSSGDDGLDPEARYQAILDDLPERARNDLDGTAEDSPNQHTTLAE